EQDHEREEADVRPHDDDDPPRNREDAHDPEQPANPLELVAQALLCLLKNAAQLNHPRYRFPLAASPRRPVGESARAQIRCANSALPIPRNRSAKSPTPGPPPGRDRGRMIPLSDGLRARTFPYVNVAIIVACFAVWIFYELPHLDRSIVHASFYPC